VVSRVAGDGHAAFFIMIQGTVRIELKDLEKFGAAVDEALANPNSSSPVRSALKQWAARYRGFARDRFDRYSKGGGDWPALAISTARRRKDIAKRRARIQKLQRALSKLKKSGASASRLKKARASLEKATRVANTRRSSAARDKGRLVNAGGVVSILRDTGTLFNALDPQFTGKPGALEHHMPFGVEVGYGGPGRYPDGATVADIASFHQEGGGRLPKREIVVAPPETVMVAMAADMERALGKM
jgi:hypothetical protein